MTLGVPSLAAERAAPAGRTHSNNRLLTLVAESGSRNIRRHWQRHASRISVLIVADLAVYATTATVILWIAAGGLGVDAAAVMPELFPTEMLISLAWPVAVLLGLVISGAYGAGHQRRDTERVFGGVALAGLFTMYESMWTDFGPAFTHYAVTVSLFVLVLKADRLAVDWVVVRLGKLFSARVVIVGDTDLHDDVLGDPPKVKGDRIEVVGTVAVSDDGGEVVGPPIEALGEVIHAKRADTVIIRRPLRHDDFTFVVDQALASGCRLLAGSRVARASGVEPRLVSFYTDTLVELTAPHLKGWQLAIKRSIDVVAAGLGIILLSPLLAVIAVAIKLDSPGPVFFRQERVGFGCRVFKMVKFRTMRVGADEEKHRLAHLNESGDARLFKIANDPRVTPLGVWLRRWSLDELPQLWNVLTGNMSLVGPRPFFEADLVDYSEHHFIRMCAKPGITGFWQVNGRSSVVDFEEVVWMDREYVNRWSLWMDLSILWRTIPAVLRRTGAF